MVCNAVFVAANAFTNAMSSSRDKSSGTHPFSLPRSHFTNATPLSAQRKSDQSVKLRKKDLTSHVSSMPAHEPSIWDTQLCSPMAVRRTTSSARRSPLLPLSAR